MAAGVVDATDGVEVPNLTPGLTPFMATVTIATTSIDDAGDDVLLFKFPAGAYLLSSSLVFKPSDMDGASATLDFDVGIGDVDGVIDTVIINDTTAANTGFAALAASGLTTHGGFIDAGGKYLIATVATAATTGVAGTIEVSGIYAGGLVPIVSS